MKPTRAAIRAEITKVVTLPTVALVAVALLALHALIQVIQLPLYRDAIAGIDAQGSIEIFTGSRVPAAPEMTKQLVAAMFTPVPFVAVLGALIAGSEFRSGELGISLTAVPSRPRLVLAKAVATAGLTAVLCLLFAVLTSLVMLPVVSGWNPAILVSPDVLSGYARATLVGICTTYITLGITLVTRRALVAVLIMAVLLGVTITQLLARISPGLDAVFPISAARNLLFHGSRDVVPPLTSGPGMAAVVLLAWAIGAVAVAAVVLNRRDAR